MYKLVVFTLSCLGLLLPLTGVGAEDEVNDDGFFGLGWLDQTQSNLSGRADNLAGRLDRFFGVERSDLEAAYSSLRLGTELRVQEGEGVEPRLRLRGRLYLPRIDERISLIFSEDRGEGATYYQNDVLNEQQSTRVNLEVNLAEQEKYRFDFRVGLRSNLKLRTSVRFRYEDDLSENMQQRLSQTVYFIDDQGFGSFTQYQIDRELNSSNLLRWSTEFRGQEDLDTLEWGTSLNHVSSFGNNGAISYFGRLAGTTDQNHIGQYQLGLRMRRSIARPWLFLEVTPIYSWDKLTNDVEREGNMFLSVRLEMAIGRLETP